MTDLALPRRDAAAGCLCCERFLLPVLVCHPGGLFCSRRTVIQNLCEYSIFVRLLLCQTPDWNRLVGLEIMQSVIACLASYGKEAKNKPVYDLHKFYSNQNTGRKKKRVLACERVSLCWENSAKSQADYIACVTQSSCKDIFLWGYDWNVSFYRTARCLSNKIRYVIRTLVSEMWCYVRTNTRANNFCQTLQ